MNESRITIFALLLLLLAACGSPARTPTTVPAAGTPAVVTTPEPLVTNAEPTTASLTPTATHPTTNNLKIVFLLAANDTPRQQLFEQLFTETTRPFTGTVQIETADNEAATQRQQVQTALDAGVPILVIQPVDPDAAAEFVDAAHKVGTKVIAFDRLINTRDLDGYVSHDLAQTGRLQAQAAVDYLTAAKVKTPWNFIFLEGAAGDPVAAEITHGYHEVLDPFIAKNQVKIIADRANTDSTAQQGQTATTEELTKAKNNVDAILANTSALALGAIQALTPPKLTGKVFVAGSGADPDNLRAICNGTQNLDLTRDDAELARSAARLAMSLANDQTPTQAGFPNSTIAVDDRNVFQVAIPVRAITSDTIQAALVQTGIVTASSLGNCFPPLPTGASVPQVNSRDTLTVWVQEDPASPIYAYLSNLAAAYMAANPGVQIQLVTKDAQTVRDSFADAASGVDLLWTTNEEIQLFAASNLLRPTDFITGTQFVSPSIGGATRAGTLYGVPVETGNNLLLYYNKKLMKTPPADTDALVRLGATLTKEASGQYALVYDTTDPFWLFPWLGAYKGSVVGADGRSPTLDTKPMSQTLTLLKTFKDKKVAAPDADLATADGVFTGGRAAMIINGDEALDGYLAKFGTDLGVTSLPPVPKSDAPHPYTGGMYFAMPTGVTADKLEIAQGFIRLLTSKPIQLDMAKKFHRLPALQDAIKDSTLTNDPILNGMASQMLLGIPAPDSTILTCIWDSVRPNQIAVINGQSQPADAASAMQTAAQTCVSKLP